MKDLNQVVTLSPSYHESILVVRRVRCGEVKDPMAKYGEELYTAGDGCGIEDIRGPGLSAQLWHY